MTLNQLAAEVHQNAVEHGWWETPPSFPEIVALCHAELSEALEEYRAGRPMVYYPCNDGDLCVDDRAGISCGSRTYDPKHPDAPCSARSKKPEGMAVEMADCILRILDWAGENGVDMDAILRQKMEYNKTRPYRHGGKVL